MKSQVSTAMTTNTVRLSDIDVTYTRAGTGVPVVLVHGLAEDHHSWHTVQESVSAFTTYAYDLRGHGATTVGDSDGSLEQLRDDLLHFLETVTGPAICIGFSLGGTIVLAAAAHRPGLMQRVIALGTSSVVGRGAGSFYAGRIELFRGSDKAEQQTALRADTAAALHNPSVDVDEVTRRRLTAIGDARGYINASRAMSALVDTPLTPALSTITSDLDVTIVGADNDTFCPKKAADIIIGAVEHASYEEITDAGHLMMVDQPDQSIELIKRILTS